MSLLWIIILIALVLAVVGALPHWPYSATWGYGASGGIGVILLILVLLIIFGRI